jgi:hypothetical protein
MCIQHILTDECESDPPYSLVLMPGRNVLVLTSCVQKSCETYWTKDVSEKNEEMEKSERDVESRALWESKLTIF